MARCRIEGSGPLPLLSVIVFALIGLSCSSSIDSVQLASPGGGVSAVITVDEVSGRLTYSVSHGGNVVIEPSSLGIILGDHDLGGNTRIVEQSTYAVNETYMLHGARQQVENRAEGIVLSLESGEEGTPWQLEARAYDVGFAYRYIVPGAGKRLVHGEATSFVVPADTKVWFFERDSEWKLKTYAGWFMRAGIDEMPTVSAQGPVQGGFLTLELPSGGYAVITESNLFEYSGMRLRAEDNRTFRADFTEADGFELEGPITTPWRVVICAKDLNGLVNQRLVHNLAGAPDPELFADTSYVKPGRSVWRWWSSDTGNPQQETKYIDYAKQLGFEYSTIDAGWKEWEKPWENLAKIGAYSKTQGVGVILWTHWNDVKDPADNYALLREFLDKVRKAGLCGVKVDFMNGENLEVVRFNEAVLREAARRKLLVNFHGCGKPAGESRRYPNEITREAIRGMELNRMGRWLRTSHYAALPFTRFPIGHGDFTPFTVNPDRLGGTTISLQLATLVCYDSPLLMFSENPELIFPGSRNAALLPFVKRIPVTWDETRVLPGSSIGEVAAMARRQGNEWFVGVINGGAQREFSMNLDFLTAPAKAVLYSDNLDDAAAFVMKEITVRPGQEITATLGKGGGFTAWLKPE